MTPEEARQKREYNLKKFGLSKEEIDRILIPVVKEKETTEVFDKKTNQQLEREKLLSRLTVLRSALQYLQTGSSSVRISLSFVILQSSDGSKRKRRSGRKRRRYEEFNSEETTDDDMSVDFANMPKRQSRRQRGLKPEYTTDYIE